jgi:conjugative relaxase-like TrwC/TraI family protein
MLRISVATADGSREGGQDLQAAINYYEDTQAKALAYYEGGRRVGVEDQINTHGGEHSERPTTVFGGARALAALGLTDGQQMVRDQVAALALGIHPDGKTRLLREGKRTAFHDFTFSTSKSVGVLFASLRAQGREEEAQALLDTLREAAQIAVIHYAAHYPTSRTRLGDTQLPTMAELVCLADTHSAARPVEGIADPELHMHMRVLNVALRQDGTWSSRYYREMHNAARALNGVFEATLRRHIDAMGWATRDQVHGDKSQWTSFEVVEVPDAANEIMSGRQHAIDRLVEEKEAELGRSLTQKERAATSRNSRNAKAPKTRDEQTAQWAEKLAAVGYVASQPSVIDTGSSRERATEIARLVERAPADLLASQSLWRHEDTLAYVANLAVHLRLSEAEVTQLASEIETDTVSLTHPLSGVPHFTTQTRIDQEKTVADYLLDLSSDARIAVKNEQIEEAIQAFELDADIQLDAEQKAAVHALAGSEGLVILQGWAGAGKTTSTQPACRALKAAGYQVLGTSTSSKATSLLQEDAQIACWNTRDLITRADHMTLWDASGNPVNLGPRTILFVDEAVMSNVLDLSDLCRIAREYHIAGIRLVGDTAQLPPIRSGSLVAHVLHKIDFAQVTRNYRAQIEDEAISAAMLREGRGVLYLQGKDARGLLDAEPSFDAAVRAAIQDWAQVVQRPEDAARNLLLCDLREKGVKVINERVRQLWIERGWIDPSRSIEIHNQKYAVGDRVELQTIHREKVSRTDENGNVIYRRGPAIRTSEGKLARDGSGKVLYEQVPRYHTISTPVRTRGFVRSIEGSTLSIHTDQQGGLKSRTIHLSAEQAGGKALDYGWAGTVHVSQGTTVDSVFVVVPPSRLVGQQSGYVSASRARLTTKVYLPLQEIEENNKVRLESRNEAIQRVGGQLSRDLSQATTLDFLDERSRENFANRLREQQETSREPWSADRPISPSQLSLIRHLQGDAGSPEQEQWSWLRASCEIDLYVSGCPGLQSERWLEDHGVSHEAAHERVNNELRSAGLNMTADMHDATPEQQHLAERYVQQYVEAERLQGREPSLDTLADMRARSLARVVRSAEHFHQEQGTNRAADLERQRQAEEAAQPSTPLDCPGHVPLFVRT